jgi:hypothetical protein
MFQCALEGNAVGPGREARAVRAPRRLQRARSFSRVSRPGVHRRRPPLLDLSKIQLASLHGVPLGGPVDSLALRFVCYERDREHGTNPVRKAKSNQIQASNKTVIPELQQARRTTPATQTAARYGPSRR